VTSGAPGDEGRLPAALTAEEAAELARRHGLEKVGVRPGLWHYLRELWQRRSFLFTLAQGDFIASTQNNLLGLVWSVLNPLLLGLAYLVIFGILLDTSGNVEDFITFLTTGLFTFIYISAGLNYGARSMTGNISLVRSLRFPRIILPLSVSVSQFLATVPAFAILVVIALVRGQRPSVEWLLFPVSLLVVGVLTTGLGLIAARVVHEVRDASNVIPLLTRMLRYVSGIFFPVAEFAQGALERGLPQWGALILEYQPIAVSLTLVRETLMGELPVDPVTWIVATGWAVLLFGIGVVVFWQAEATYGRS
jgi:teichoic acid transport system permease protein